MFSNRDLIGYGNSHPNPRWPNGALVAISFVLNYEEGGEHTFVNGDIKSEVFLSETPGATPRAERDMNMETQYEYGSRCGGRRIINLFDQFGFKVTVFGVGRAIQLNPNLIMQMHENGHEIASHRKGSKQNFSLLFIFDCKDYRWIDYASLPEHEERVHVKACIDVFEETLGSAPVGWYTGRISPKSRDIVVEEYDKRGLKLLYDSDCYNDDLPYWKTKPNGEGHLVIPYTLDQNDMKFCVAPGFTSPNDF